MEAIKPCGKLPPLNYGYWNDSACHEQVVYSTVCLIICYNGYSLNGKPGTVSCQGNGTFTPDVLPECKG